MNDLNRCVYCLRAHDRDARCCTPDCERRVRGKVAYVTRSRRQATGRVMQELQRRARFVRTWRRIAMGEADLQLAFGCEPAPGPLRHGDTLDA